MSSKRGRNRTDLDGACEGHLVDMGVVGDSSSSCGAVAGDHVDHTWGEAGLPQHIVHQKIFKANFTKSMAVTMID